MRRLPGKAAASALVAGGLVAVTLFVSAGPAPAGPQERAATADEALLRILAPKAKSTVKVGPTATVTVRAVCAEPCSISGTVRIRIGRERTKSQFAKPVTSAERPYPVAVQVIMPARFLGLLRRKPRARKAELLVRITALASDGKGSPARADTDSRSVRLR